MAFDSQNTVLMPRCSLTPTLIGQSFNTLPLALDGSQIINIILKSYEVRNTFSKILEQGSPAQCPGLHVARDNHISGLQASANNQK